jgi:3D (Asp-Asp-Asp) domain-containing protein
MMIGFFVSTKNMNNYKEYLKLAKNKLVEGILVLISLLTLANLVMFPIPTFADTGSSTLDSIDNTVNYELVPENKGDNLIQILNPEVMFYDNNGQVENGHLPQNDGLEEKYSITAVITAYNSDIGQTDNSPCITANGFDLCKHGQEDSVAINGMKMGTRVRIPELFGDRVFVVRDRMNARYSSDRVDVWMISRSDAKKFGVKVAKLEVLE